MERTPHIMQLIFILIFFRQNMESLKEFLENSTIHGLYHISTSRSARPYIQNMESSNMLQIQYRPNMQFMPHIRKQEQDWQSCLVLHCLPQLCQILAKTWIYSILHKLDLNCVIFSFFSVQFWPFSRIFFTMAALISERNILSCADKGAATKKNFSYKT